MTDAKHYIIPVPNPQLPFLSGAMKLRGVKGMCFHRAVALCLDIPGSSVVVGTLRAATPEERIGHPERSTTPHLHAWVEFEGKLMAPTTIEANGGLVFVRPQEYYQICGATNIRRLSRSALTERVVDRHINRELLFGIRPLQPGYLVSRLLDAVGVKYIISPAGGVLPIGAKMEAANDPTDS